MAFLTDLATNATAHNMTIIIFSGNDDSLIPHLGSQSRSPIVFVMALLTRTDSNYPSAISEITLGNQWHSFIPLHRIRRLVVSGASLVRRRRRGTTMLENSRASSIKSVDGRTPLPSTQGIFSAITTPSLLAVIISNRLARSNTLRAGPHARSGVYLWQQPNGTRHQRQRLFGRCHRRRGDLPRQHHDRPSGYLLWFRDDRIHLFLPNSHRGSVEQVRRDCHLTVQRVRSTWQAQEA